MLTIQRQTKSVSVCTDTAAAVQPRTNSQRCQPLKVDSCHQPSVERRPLREKEQPRSRPANACLRTSQLDAAIGAATGDSLTRDDLRNALLLVLLTERPTRFASNELTAKPAMASPHSATVLGSGIGVVIA